MADYQITKDTAAKTLQEAISGLESGKLYDVSINERNIGKWTLTRLSCILRPMPHKDREW